MIKVVLTTSAVLLTCITVARAHEGSWIYPIFELPPSQLPDLHDGTLEDWEDVLPQSSLTQNDFWSNTGEHDLPFRIFLGWSLDQQRIFVGLERFDDFFDESREMFRLEVDGDHSGGLFWFDTREEMPSPEEQDLLESNGQWYQYQPQDGERELFGNGEVSPWSRALPYTDFGVDDFGESPNQLTLELMLTLWDRLDRAGPELSRQSELFSGKIIGLQITLIDSDPGSFGLYAVTESLPDERYNANAMIDGELISCESPGCSSAATAAETDSWARIKSSLVE